MDELCTSREVRLRSQESDHPRPVDRTARRALTVYGGALRSSLAVALRLSRGEFGAFGGGWLSTFGKPRRRLPAIPRDAPGVTGRWSRGCCWSCAGEMSLNMRFGSHSLRRLYQSLRGRSVLFRAAGPGAAGADIEATSRRAGGAAADEGEKHRPTYRECCLCRISRERRHMLSITSSIPARSEPHTLRVRRLYRRAFPPLGGAPARSC